MTAKTPRGARFERSDLSGCTVSLLDEIEILDCVLDEANFSMSDWRKAHITRCQLHGTWLSLAHFDNATVDGSDFLGTYAERSFWQDANLSNVSFRGCTLVDGVFEGATFTDCDFHYANFSRKDLAGDFARSTNTRIVRCNFQGANLDGLRFNNTVFDHCVFNDTTGKPDLEGPCTLIEPDFSPRGDGYDGHTGKSAIRDPEGVLSVWRDWDAARIGFWSGHPAGTVYEPEKHYPERRRSKDDDKDR